MKLVLCLLTVCCAAFVSGVTLEERKLAEVLKQLGDVKDSLQRRELLVNTPPQNIEECCCLSALQCFRNNLLVQFNVTEMKEVKLYRSLKHHITERGLDFCKSGNKSGNDVSTCQTCDSHPKATAREFVSRLESLIQRAISRLSNN
ncbi:interleukin-21 [Festucalex cinctus]